MKPFQFCLPKKGTKVPSRPNWLHEIKFDGYRMRVVREDKRVRLFTKEGHDWTDRYPRIVETALKMRVKRFVIDGEAVVRGIDGNSDFKALHSRRHDQDVEFYAFDILTEGGDDLTKLPLKLRKNNLARLLDRRPDGIFVAWYEAGEIGPELFEAACKMGLEGIVSKDEDRPYRFGPCEHWIKVKNPNSPAVAREKEWAKSHRRRA